VQIGVKSVQTPALLHSLPAAQLCPATKSVQRHASTFVASSLSQIGVVVHKLALDLQ
jgi:hypothetical protein